MSTDSRKFRPRRSHVLGAHLRGLRGFLTFIEGMSIMEAELHGIGNVLWGIWAVLVIIEIFIIIIALKK